MIRKAVIPAAGLGTRLLPATKQQPKEMLPIFATDDSNGQYLKPFVQLVFEELYEVGIREFCFIIGRGKRSIEDHFVVDKTLLKYLRGYQVGVRKELDRFHRKIEKSNISFVNQAEPSGFGDAVRLAKWFTNKDDFIVHAGDDLVISRNGGYLTRLMDTFEKYDADAVLCVERVKDPERYGVVEGQKMRPNIYRVTRIEEKPRHPRSDLAVIAVYAFRERIYDSLDKIRVPSGHELQLTSGIQRIIDAGGIVYAMQIRKDERRVDIGTPESYWMALNLSKKRTLSYGEGNTFSPLGKPTA